MATISEPNNKATILVVDDSPETLALMGELLSADYNVKLANNPERGLQIASAEVTPDLILLDILMPGIDGYEALGRLRESENTKNIPVIFLTALQNEEAEQRGLELGAADFIHKPINSVIVLSRIRVHLEAKVARDMLRKHNQRLLQRVDEGVKALEQAQLLLMQSEKMAAMGQLAAGIAHEINNPTAFVSSNLATLQTYMQDIFALVDAYERVRLSASPSLCFDEADSLRKKIDYNFLRKDISDLIRESQDGVGRVRKIVLDLKDFSHTSDTSWEWADLHRGLESTLNIVWNELKYKCKIIKKYGQLPPIYCLASQLNQVFMNILVNAAQAIETRGEIEIITELAGDDSVRIIFRDTGKGIPADNLKHIFDPFFTTKPVGKGTGLGLSLSWGIVERHHGKIEVASEVGVGTTFTITLPIEGEHSVNTADKE